MKLLLFLFILLISCTKETPCDCDRINYRSKVFKSCNPEFNPTCLGFTVEDTIYDIGCELEQGKIQYDTNKWYEVKCYYKEY